ncbi:hypothetical protein KBB25_01150 [Candidatus Gracilibacteria bacterium]|nr:hypothetical protein [Candidatus Gracilibacteria bacterium]
MATGAGQTYAGSASPPPNGGGNKGKKDDGKNNKFENDKGTILTDKNLFSKVEGRKTQGAQWYKEKGTGNIYYRDNFHKNELEVFTKNGKHLGEANPITGKIKPGTASKDKTIYTK